jgi:hypothetical protein
MRRYLIASVIIHLAVLLSIVGLPAAQNFAGGKGDGDGKGSPRVMRGIIPKPTEVTLLESDSKDKGHGRKAKQRDCTHWFGGIGIHINYNEVTRVVPGYPAYEAGILVGDMLWTPVSDIQGPPGTIVVIKLVRPSTHEHLTFTIVRDRICTEK